ncbi:MAG TPA: helix-turn-helix transcriptional regulator [Anaerolineae bacterium]|nr:helix-turn-helix transcriptional regulator [Anaerolineae bacterium]
MSEVFSRIDDVRRKKGVSYKKLAEICGVSPQNVQRWKTGGNIMPEHISKLAMYFGVTTDWLLTGREDVSTRLEYGMREMLFEARGATGLAVPGLAAKMGVDKRDVEKIMNEGGNPTLALSEAFEKHLQPAIDAARSSAPGCPGCAALKSEVDFLRARLTEALSKIPTPPGN